MGIDIEKYLADQICRLNICRHEFLSNICVRLRNEVGCDDYSLYTQRRKDCVLVMFYMDSRSVGTNIVGPYGFKIWEDWYSGDQHLGAKTLYYDGYLKDESSLTKQVTCKLCAERMLTKDAMALPAA